MKIAIKHIEKSQGLVFKKDLYGVQLDVVFSEEERAVIEQRKLANTTLMERGAPADVDADKHANRGLLKKVATTAMGGSNHFHLTIHKLQQGTDTFWFNTPGEAKVYENTLKGRNATASANRTLWEMRKRAPEIVLSSDFDEAFGLVGTALVIGAIIMLIGFGFLMVPFVAAGGFGLYYWRNVYEPKRKEEAQAARTQALTNEANKIAPTRKMFITRLKQAGIVDKDLIEAGQCNLCHGGFGSAPYPAAVG